MVSSGSPYFFMSLENMYLPFLSWEWHCFLSKDRLALRVTLRLTYSRMLMALCMMCKRQTMNSVKFWDLA